jgi:hypothetical protein
MASGKPFHERQSFQEGAPNNIVAGEQLECEAPVARHLTVLEQQVLHAALRRSVKILSN